MADFRYIAGIDPSLSGTAVCVKNFDPTPQVYRFTSEPSGPRVSQRIARYVILAKQVLGVVPVGSLVFIEGYSFGSKGGQAVDRAEYGGILRNQLDEAACQMIEVPPTSLKKWATGHGAGDKTPMIAALTKRYGVEFRTNDEYDAYALARLGEQYAGLEKPLNQIQADVIAKLKAGPVKKTRKGKS